MRTSLSVVSLLLFLEGCYSWRADHRVLAQSPEPGTRAQIWVAGTSYEVHGIRVRPDSISAVPYWQAAGCDSCRIQWAIPAIDSVRVRHEAPVGSVLLAGALVGLVALVLTIRAGLGNT